MRFSLVVAVVLVGVSVSSWAQKGDTFKVKPAQEKPTKTSAPVGKTTPTVSASAANAKALQNAEHQGVKGGGASRSVGKKTAAPGLKPVKDKPNPPINFNGTGNGKNGGGNKAGADPYKGRLKQKGSGHGTHSQ